MDGSESNATYDAGLMCLIVVARLHEISASIEQIQHNFGASSTCFDNDGLVRAAKWIGLKARQVKSKRRKLGKVACPCIAQLSDGRFVVLAGTANDSVLIHDPLAAAPYQLKIAAFESNWSGDLILCARRASIEKLSKTFDIAWFVPFILKYKPYLGDVLVASMALQVFALLTPLFFQIVVDKVLVHGSLTTLDILAVGLLGVSVFELVLAVLRTYIFAQTTSRIDVALGSELFKHLLNLPITYFKVRRIGDIVARVRELETIREFITGSSITLLVDLFFTLIFFAVLILYSPRLSCVVIASLPLYLTLAIVITPLLRMRLEQKFNAGANSQSYLVESIVSIETLKAAAVEPTARIRWDERLAAYVAASFKVSNLVNIATQLAALINKLVVVGILWLGARLVISGELSIGQLIAFNMIAGRVAGPIMRVVQTWQEFQQARVSLARLGDVLNAQPESAQTSSQRALPALCGRVCFDHVQFSYPLKKRPVLDDLSFTVEPGEVVGIVGRSGSGKSTLTKLIQRLYVPDSGRVLVDDIDLSLVDTAWLRRQIGVVLQENVLFNRTIRENIAFIDPTIGVDSVIDAAKLAGAHEFIVELPLAYDTIVDEQGANLSGGQRQRIAIARALVSDPRILVFDEATSALDYESEATIQRNMRAICRNKTAFIVAHRLSSVRASDRIFVFDRGKIVEAGTHTELVRNDAYYAQLCRLQVGDTQ